MRIFQTRRFMATISPLAILACCCAISGCGPSAPTPEEKAALVLVEQNGAKVFQQPGGAVKVDFTHMGAKDADLEPLQHIKHLQMLILAYTDITDDGLKYIADLPRIHQISLKGTKITDEGLKHLSTLTSVEELDLSDTGVSDTGMPNIAKMSGLKKIYLNGTRVTFQGRKVISESLPDTTIFKSE